MNIKENGNWVNIITLIIKAMLGGVLTMVIGFIGSLMAIALLSAHNLRLLLKKMGLRKSEPKYIKRKT
jgi:5-bromo-4-chloroindolyl phosphate hydrolysis protein